MILKVSVFVIGLCVGAVFSASIDCNIEKCAKPSKVYEELGCKAVYGAKSCCAKRFECPDFKKLDENKCNFEGKEYAIGEVLPRNSTDSKCSETCFCTRQGNEPARFACTNSDCGVSSFKVPGCINVYGDLNECCSTSIVCDDEEKKTLATCYVGQEYREGEKFIPASNPCYECLCHKDFDNSTIHDNPYCRKLNCEIDLRYKSFVQRGCLPVFHSEKCCPVDWECPKHGKKVVKRAAVEESQTVKQDLFIVTPSKNLEEYLDIVKLANPIETDESSSKAPETSPKPISIPSTEPFVAPTLSTNPLEVPINEVTVPVIVQFEDTTRKAPEKESDLSTEDAIDPRIKSSEVSSKSEATTTEKNEETTEIVTEITKISTDKLIESQSSTESSEKSTESSTDIPVTTKISTESFQDSETSTEIKSTVTTTEKIITTQKSTTTEDDSSSSESSEESGETVFNKLLEKNIDSNESALPKKSSSSESNSSESMSSESSSTESVTTTRQYTESSVVLTSETPKEVGRSLELPEELTTLSEKVTTTSEAPTTKVLLKALTTKSVEIESSTTEKSSSEMFVTETSKSESQSTDAPKIVVPATELPKTESPETEVPKTELPATDAPTTTSKAPVTREIPSDPIVVKDSPSTLSEPPKIQIDSEPAKILIKEVLPEITEIPVTKPVLTEEVQSTEATTTIAINPAINVLPTEFEKLLTTLREFVAKVESVTSTEAPKSTDLPKSTEDSTSTEVPKTTEIPQLEQSIETVNYTVSTGSEKVEESKSISKRSVPDADLVPRYFKQHYGSNKDKGCVFNGRSFKLGEPIKTDNECLKCICEYAPIGHCMLKEKCNF